MNLLEALKQIAEHTDKDERQYFMPGETQRAGDFPVGRRGNLLTEMYRQTVAAQQGPPQTTLKDVRLNPDAVARFIREQEPSENIDDRTRQPIPDDQFDPRSLDAPPLRRDPFDPLAQLLGINSIAPRAMTVPDIPLPRPRPRR